MISRTSGILLVSYILILLGGLGFVITPSPTIADASHDVQSLIWGLFYLLGGLVSALATGLRPILLSKVTPLWYFEIAGVSLIISANLVYMYALYVLAIGTGYLNLLALSGVLLAYSFALVARSYEVLSLIKYLGQFALTPQAKE